mmetsp:Transcript_12017/g.25414  ORF Transcript_12017/g.25414 Transcript_12017/m.25414 type:complete len:80 (+) Transcript_12017:277-516(+)
MQLIHKTLTPTEAAVHISSVVMMIPIGDTEFDVAKKWRHSTSLSPIDEVVCEEATKDGRIWATAKLATTLSSRVMPLVC